MKSTSEEKQPKGPSKVEVFESIFREDSFPAVLDAFPPLFGENPIPKVVQLLPTHAIGLERPKNRNTLVNGMSKF